MAFGTLTITHHDGRQETVTLAKPTVSVGAAQGNDVVLSDANAVDYHAQLLCDERGCQVLDLDSPRGTFLLGERVDPQTPQSVPDGAELRIGKTILTYHAPGSNVSGVQPPLPVVITSPPVAPTSAPPVDGGRTTVLPTQSAQPQRPAAQDSGKTTLLAAQPAPSSGQAPELTPKPLPRVDTDKTTLWPAQPVQPAGSPPVTPPTVKRPAATEADATVALSAQAAQRAPDGTPGSTERMPTLRRPRSRTSPAEQQRQPIGMGETAWRPEVEQAPPLQRRPLRPLLLWTGLVTLLVLLGIGSWFIASRFLSSEQATPDQSPSTATTLPDGSSGPTAGPITIPDSSASPTAGPITIPDGSSGPTAGPPATQEQRYVVTASNPGRLNIRRQPGTASNNPPVTSLPNGTVVRIVEEPVNVDGVAWVRIEAVDSDVEGWCIFDALTPQ